MNAAGYVLVLLDALPLPHRAIWAAWLAQVEPHPQHQHEAHQIMHESGLLAHGKLTVEGEQAARLALHAALRPASECCNQRGNGAAKESR